MSSGTKCKYSKELKEHAVKLLDEGFGSVLVARKLGISVKYVGKWLQVYRAVGRNGLLNMGKTHQKYDFETKVAAVKAVVDEGSSKTMVMERFGIVSVTALENWCRLYRSGGVEALRSKPRGSLKNPTM